MICETNTTRKRKRIKGREENKKRGGEEKKDKERRILHWRGSSVARFRNVTIFCIDRGDLSESMRKPHDFPRLLDSCRSPANLKYEPATKSRVDRGRNQLVSRIRETVMTNSDGIKFNTRLTNVEYYFKSRILLFSRLQIEWRIKLGVEYARSMWNNKNGNKKRIFCPRLLSIWKNISFLFSKEFEFCSYSRYVSSHR